MVSAAEDEDRVGQHRAFVAAAAQAGVAHVVYTSFADVVRVATAVLREPEKHRGAAHELTGPEALSFRDVAEQVPAATGRPVTYHDESPEEAYAPRAPYGAPRWQVDAWVSTYPAIATGRLARVTDDVQRLTGRPPLSLRQFLVPG